VSSQQPVERIPVEIEVEGRCGGAVIGRIVAGGEVGARVLVGATDACGECEVCRRGGVAVCPQAVRRREIGARVVVANRWLVPLGDGLDLPVPEGAAVAADVAVAYTLYARTGLAPRDPAVVVGVSPVARFLVEILRAKGITPVVLADPAATAWCRWLGARGAAVTHEAAGVTAALIAQGLGARPWRVLAVAPEAAAEAARLAGPRATLTLFAPVDAPPAPLPGELASREVTVIGVAGPHPDLVVEAAAMCVKGEIDLAGGVSRHANDELRAIVELPA
jgi:(R,R)-butanediol dehydrogenase / meso-butanediol dehydrogenase / diacetyl reductase